MLQFIFGMLVGGFLGIIIMSLCFVSGRYSDTEENGKEK